MAAGAGDMGDTLRSYAAFHQRTFDPATPCGERRVLVVRESFSDVVGVGHAHMGLQRLGELSVRGCGRAWLHRRAGSAAALLVPRDVP